MNVTTELADLHSFQSLKVVELIHSLRPKNDHVDGTIDSRTPDASSTIENVTPAGLEADLVHYKELFSKLRFAYVEQVTKEKFLRAITDNPPLLVESQQNAELEIQLGEAKASLKTQKSDVSTLIAELDHVVRKLCQRYDVIQAQTFQLNSIPSDLLELEASIAELQAKQAPHPTNPSLSLPLSETLPALSHSSSEIESLRSQLAVTEASLPRRSHELERLEKELQNLERKARATTASAKEARRKRECGAMGIEDELDERGKWLSAVEKGLVDMLHK